MSRRIIPITMFLLLLNACAYTIEKVDIAYKPGAAAKPLPGAKSITVALDVQDARTTYQDRIGSKKNPLGNESGAIVSSRGVPALVTDAMRTELQRRGFRIGPGPVTVRVGIERFYSNFIVGPAIGDSYGEVVLSVQVRGAGTSSYHAKKYAGESNIKGPVWMEYENTKKSIEPAFAQAVQNLMADKQFFQAISVANSAR